MKELYDIQCYYPALILSYLFNFIDEYMPAFIEQKKKNPIISIAALTNRCIKKKTILYITTALVWILSDVVASIDTKVAFSEHWGPTIVIVTTLLWFLHVIYVV